MRNTKAKREWRMSTLLREKKNPGQQIRCRLSVSREWEFLPTALGGTGINGIANWNEADQIVSMRRKICAVPDDSSEPSFQAIGHGQMADK